MRVVGSSHQKIRAWREGHPDECLDLIDAKLSQVNLSGAPLGLVDFSLSDLSWVNLCGAEPDMSQASIRLSIQAIPVMAANPFNAPTKNASARTFAKWWRLRHVNVPDILIRLCTSTGEPLETA